MSPEDPGRAAPSLQTLAETARHVVVAANEKKARIATVESCTGGLVAHLITEVPGASQVLEAGWVCYSNQAKMRFLGVPRELLLEHGAVSEPVARALAEGGRDNAGVDYAVAATGIAGPTGATPGKPVGSMWSAVAGRSETRAAMTLAQGLDRSETKRVFAAQALGDLLKLLQEGK